MSGISIARGSIPPDRPSKLRSWSSSDAVTRPSTGWRPAFCSSNDDPRPHVTVPVSAAAKSVFRGDIRLNSLFWTIGQMFLGIVVPLTFRWIAKIILPLRRKPTPMCFVEIVPGADSWYSGGIAL